MTQTARVQEKWSKTADEIMKRANRYLWHDQLGKEPREIMHSLGLSERTIQHFRLGYMPLVNGKFSQFSFDSFGLDPAQLPKAQRDKGGINVPDGILIPWYQDGQIVKLTVMRPGQVPEYGQIVGSADCLFNGDSVHPDRPTLMVEAERSALMIWERAHDLVAVVATGSERKCRNVHCIDRLNRASFVLQAFDENAVADHWCQFLKRCMRWAPWYKTMQIREWVEAGILSAQVEFS